MKGCPGGVEQPGEDRAGPALGPAEDPGEDQELADDQVSEQHVEQQLLVGPPGAVRLAPQLGGCRVVQQVMERLPGSLHLVADRFAVEFGGTVAGHADAACR